MSNVSVVFLSMPSSSAVAACCRLCRHTHHLGVRPAAVLPGNVQLLLTPHLSLPPRLHPLSHHYPPLCHPENLYAPLFEEPLDTASVYKIHDLKENNELQWNKNEKSYSLWNRREKKRNNVQVKSRITLTIAFFLASV